MTPLATDMLGYVAAAVLAWFLLGCLARGRGIAGRIAAARLDGVLSARTSLDGEPKLRARLQASFEERDRLEAEIDRLLERIAGLEGEATRMAAASPAPPDAGAEAQPVARGAAPAAAAPVGGATSPAEGARVDDAASSGDIAPASPGAAGAVHSPATPDGPADETAGQPPEAADATPESGTGAAPAAEAAGPGGEAGPEEQTEALAGAGEKMVAPADLLSARPAEVDELRRIRGIGRVMERLLNETGIWQFRQIAGLSPEGVVWLTGEVGATEGRIGRDRWVEQARALHREKYGAVVGRISLPRRLSDPEGEEAPRSEAG